MAEKIKVGVIGVGHLGQHHARNYYYNPRAELAYVCDADGHQARKIARAYGAKATKDYTDLIGKVQAVSIATPTAPRAASPRPSANPFLSKDPGQKARRLARALVSDIVVYHPEKRLEGLRHGTLKQIFEEEIKKSWEEYAGQVGRELAESTTHFNDALNEILGDGSKIF